MLTVTSNADRTSPVHARQVDAGEDPRTRRRPRRRPTCRLLDETKAVWHGTLARSRWSSTARTRNCASCHARMDPLGFGLENFDAIGAWRDKDGKFPIDASGTLPGRPKFRRRGRL